MMRTEAPPLRDLHRTTPWLWLNCEKDPTFGVQILHALTGLGAKMSKHPKLLRPPPL